MSSAAKLRKYGRGTATVAAAALVMTSFGPAAFAAWDVAPQGTTNTPAGWAGANLPQVRGGQGTGGQLIVNAGLQDDGTIGVEDPTRASGVDANLGNGTYDSRASLDASPTENQGAKLVQAGQDNQSVGDMWITIPNRFKSGDIIDLRLLDRSATENSDGTSNQGPSYSVGFSDVPTIEVFGPQTAGEVVHPDTDNRSALNVQAEANNAWSPAGVAPSDIRNTAPGVKPVFTSGISQTNGVQGSDNLRLRVSGEAATGDPTAVWVVKLSNVKVNLGANVTPGELRVVPFMSSKFDNQDSYYAVPWFMGNHKNGAVDFNGNAINATPNSAAREINTYTVPAYVSPVTVSSTNTDIVADDRPQSIGSLTLTETKPYALASGTYRLYVEGADISADTTALKAVLTGGDAGESVSNVTVNTTDDYVQFTYQAVTTDPKTPASIAIEGLLLSTDTPSEIKYRFSGATLEDTWLAPAGYSAAVAGGVASSADFVAGTPKEWTVSGSVVDGRNTLSSAVEGSAPTISSGASVLPAGTYTVTAGTNSGVKISGPSLVVDNITTPAALQGTTAADANYATGTDAAALIAAAETFTFTNLRVGESFTVGAANAVSNNVFTNAISVSNAASLPAGTYTVTANADTDDVNDFTLSESSSGLKLGGSADNTAAGTNIIKNGATYTTASGNFTPGTSGIAPGQSFTFNGLVDGMAFRILDNDTAVPNGANQKDILAPLDQLMQSGIASAASARIGGNNRYETAAKIAEMWANGDKSVVNGKFRNAIIASGENFPDALSASYLSQRMGAPVLLTMKGRLPADTIEALRDRQVEKVFIIGGDAAVSSAVAQQLAGLDTYRSSIQPTWDSASQSWIYPPRYTESLSSTGTKLQVQRLGGGTRYTTNQLVNMYAAAWGGANTIGKTVYRYGEAGKYTAIFARGDNFPDALAAGVLTAGVKPATDPLTSNDQALPLILTEPKELSQSAKDQIANLDVQHGIVIGSADAISDGVKSSLESQGLTTNRIGGADRYFTAAAVDEFAMRGKVGSRLNEYPGLGFPATGDNDMTSYLANGLRFPDALTAAPWIGRNGNALNLTMGTDALSDGSKDFLSKRSADIQRVVALGLGNAVSTGVLNEANKIASAK